MWKDRGWSTSSEKTIAVDGNFARPLFQNGSLVLSFCMSLTYKYASFFFWNSRVGGGRRRFVRKWKIILWNGRIGFLLKFKYFPFLKFVLPPPSLHLCLETLFLSLLLFMSFDGICPFIYFSTFSIYEINCLLYWPQIQFVQENQK